MSRYFPPGRVPRLPRIVTSADARVLGLSARAVEYRLATGRWQLVLPHTYLTSDVLTWRDRQEAALAYAGPQALLSGAAALADLGLRTVERPDDVLVLVPYQVARTSHGWARIRRTVRTPDRAPLDGPRRARVARAVADLALERRRVDDVRALVAQALRAKLCTIEELEQERLSGPRRNSRNLRIAIEDAAGGAWSAPEGRAARLLRAANVPPFEQNATIWLPNGRFLVVDFLWRELRAVLEIDSREHHFASPDQIESTEDRRLLLAAAGFTSAHKTPYQVAHEPELFVRSIENWLAARARELGHAR